MKVAFDEHIPNDVAKALKALSGDERLLRVTVYSARKYAPPKAQSDVPWLQRFARAGGKVIISGDAKMRGKLHEQRALSDAGFIVFFLARQWNQMRCHEKCAMIIRWWPHILEKMRSASPGEFFELPHSWTLEVMREVTPPPEIRGCLLAPPKVARRGGRRTSSSSQHRAMQISPSSEDFSLVEPTSMSTSASGL